MSEIRQTLIHLHTSGLTNDPKEKLVHGEIAVRYANEKPELMIKKENNEIATFIDSAATVALLSNASSSLETKIGEVSSNVVNLSGATMSIESDLATLSADTVADFAAVRSEVASASAKAYNDAVAYTNVASGVLDTKINSVKSSLETKIGEVSSEVTTHISASTEMFGKLESDLRGEIASAVSVAYRYVGSCTYDKLPASGSVIGEVWNVTDAHGDVPAGTNYAWTGTEWDALGGVVDLSIYLGVSAFTAYQTYVEEEFSHISSAITELSGATIELSGVTKELSGATVAEFANVRGEASSAFSSAVTYINAVSGNIENAMGLIETALEGEIALVASDLSALTIDVFELSGATIELSGVTKELSGATVAEFVLVRSEIASASDKVYASANTYTNGLVGALGLEVDALESKLEAVSGVSITAVQTISLESTREDKCGVTVDRNGNDVTFNFDGLVIDCGTF